MNNQPRQVGQSRIRLRSVKMKSIGIHFHIVRKKFYVNHLFSSYAIL